MRITGLSFGIFSACLGLTCFGLACVAMAAEETTLAAVASLATAMTENDPDGALRHFDSEMKDFGAIEAKLEALTSQAEISCAIDIVKDDDSNGIHTLDLDWFLELKSQSNEAQLERRRERVQVEMRQIKGRWKITKMAPLTILDPIKIR
jgi:hypothetical protein